MTSKLSDALYTEAILTYSTIYCMTSDFSFATSLLNHVDGTILVVTIMQCGIIALAYTAEI